MTQNVGHDGFYIDDQVLSSDECNLLIDVLSKSCGKGNRAGIRNLMTNPAVCSLAHDVRLRSLASRFVGPTAVPYRATLFEKSGRANWLVIWHQDTVLPLELRFDSKKWGPWSSKAGVLYAHAPTWALARVIALRIHLDASTELNGPLRVIPCSHSLGVLSEQDVIKRARDSEQINCLVPQGGVIAMRPLLIHASSKVNADLPRRVLHIEYIDSLDLGDEIRIAIA
jgi:hypothetical protein